MPPIIGETFRVWFLSALVVHGAVAGNPDAKRLYDDLLSNYNKLVRPVVNTSDVLRVCIKLKLSQLIDVVRTNTHVCSLFLLKLQDIQQNSIFFSGSKTGHQQLTLIKRFGWINNILVDSTTEFTYYRDNIKFSWAKKYLVNSTKLFGCLTMSEYLVNSNKKFISINQNLFDLNKCSWVSNKTVLLAQEKIFFSWKNPFPWRIGPS